MNAKSIFCLQRECISIFQVDLCYVHIRWDINIVVDAVLMVSSLKEKGHKEVNRNSETTMSICETMVKYFQ